METTPTVHIDTPHESIAQLVEDDTQVVNKYNKYSYFPVNHGDTERLYEQQKSQQWDVPEINMSNDRKDFNDSSEDIKNIITGILAFFAQFDGVVNENISFNISHTICELFDYKEAQILYNAITFIEDIHNKTYGALINAIIEDVRERIKILDGIDNFESIGMIKTWAEGRMNHETMTYLRKSSHVISEDLIRHTREQELLESLLTQICLEGVNFTAAFAVIYKLKDMNIFPGLCHANELIAADETLHTIAGIHIYKKLTTHFGVEPLSSSLVQTILVESVQMAEVFIKEFIGEGFSDINSDTLVEYTKMTANGVASKLNVEAPFPDASNPFLWLLKLGMPTVNNFFERDGNGYSKPVLTDDMFDSDGSDF